MDSRSLSDNRVIEASRKFVCIRLATYEDEKEAAFLKSIYKSRSGELENTVFAILSPDGKRKLTRSGRSPDRIFGHPAKMATELNRIANQYESNAADPSNDSERGLPYMKNVALALNVASADQLPVVVLFAKSPEQAALEKRLVPLVFTEPFAGQFVFAKAASADDMKPLERDTYSPGIYLVHPGKYGLTGDIQQVIDAADDSAGLSVAMNKVIREMTRYPKDHRFHVRAGIRLGLEWESEVPETDPQAVRARKRVRGER